MSRPCSRWGCSQEATYRDPVPYMAWCKEHRTEFCRPITRVVIP